MTVLNTYSQGPRQFEYNANQAHLLVFGTTIGDIKVINPHSDHLIANIDAPSNEKSNLLALSWLHNEQYKFISGNGGGDITLHDIEMLKSGKKNSVVFKYPNFPNLTSVTVNANDNLFLTSGSHGDIYLYDLPSGKLLNCFASIHENYINVLKFSNHHPYLFATSSFDTTFKLWDLRQDMKFPVYSVRTGNKLLMILWSPNDDFLLTSGVDNDVRQYCANDGKLFLKYDIERTYKESNYTRSYFMNHGDYIIVGSCEESIIRIFNAKNGKYFRQVHFNEFSSRGFPYIQSLRADPFRDFEFTALVAFNPYSIQSKMVRVSLFAS